MNDEIDASYAPIQPATTANNGVVKKAASLTVSAASQIANTNGGTVSLAIGPAPVIGTVLSVAADVTGIQNFRTYTTNAIASLAAQSETTRARLEELISKMQAANQLS